MIHKFKRTLWGLLYKLRALWHVLTGKGLVYCMRFDSEHPLRVSAANEDYLVTGCEFTGEGSFTPDQFVMDGKPGEMVAMSLGGLQRLFDS